MLLALLLAAAPAGPAEPGLLRLPAGPGLLQLPAGPGLLQLPAGPGLLQTQEAAARVAGGPASDDVSRTLRVRNAHWLPQLRGQLSGKEDARSRLGEFRLAPLRENDLASGRGWMVMATWDLSQVLYAREESQLALAHAQLARARKEAEVQAARLWIERRQARGLWNASRRPEACLALLRLTAELDAVTGGLFREALAAEEQACAVTEGEK